MLASLQGHAPHRDSCHAGRCTHAQLGIDGTCAASSWSVPTHGAVFGGSPRGKTLALRATFRTVRKQRPILKAALPASVWCRIRRIAQQDLPGLFSELTPKEAPAFPGRAGDALTFQP